MESKIVNRVSVLRGDIAIPGDKSVSHRSVMMASLSSTPVLVKNFLNSDDCLATVACMTKLGAKVEQKTPNELLISGNGLFGLKEPQDVLDAGNSGTTMRLLAGILGAQPFFSILTGDHSLCSRPMGRVIEPLQRMGCFILGRDQSKYAPLALAPASKIHGIEYKTPVASAQLKSAILLAGLFADGATVVTEPELSRDHTEKILAAFGVPISVSGTSIKLTPVSELKAPDILQVPGDISSAAFWVVAATIIPGSKIILRNVGVNPTRTGIIHVLKQMGANIQLVNESFAGQEPIADLIVSSAELVGVEIKPAIIPTLVDEIPILAVAAMFAKGRTIIRGASELRVKETDRLKAISTEFNKMGANIIETKDGLVIDGPQQLKFGRVYSHNDHRMAMALAVAGAAAQGVQIDYAKCVSISYPDFFNVLKKLSEQ
ncbi:MAG: 3-phosphoshikimate 1-carboxyvinyltransferase [Veillonellaceae bacterium]|jgi:3-phosphoshikimate 1-carboxyvinyltransferase|nr:3-phosphoshikimate 1-carboxyvinyltransferase [Veillonellaceae bacterium]